MSKGNIKLLLVILAVGLVFASYSYVYKTNMDKVDSLKSENESLEARLNDLLAKQKDRENYIQMTEDNYARFSEICADYPANIDQELNVMLVKELDQEDGANMFDIASAGLGQEQLYYTLGGSYECYKVTIPLTYTGTYEGVKSLIDYVDAYKYRMNLSSVNMAWNPEENLCTGAVTLNAYCIKGREDVEKDTVDVNVKEGVTNIFVGGEGAVKTYKYDADNGASIKSNYDIKMSLNNANGNSTDGVVVASGGADTQVTSAANQEVKVTITIEKDDAGLNQCTYQIGDSKSTFTISGSDLKIYVASSARVDDQDANGAKITVANTTDIPVFILVDGDDATSPRFSMGSKTGTVKVY